MASTVFRNQPIIKKGQQLKSLYKLTKGAAYLLDENHNEVALIQAPCYLNLAEVIYQSPIILTIKAQGRCEVLKIMIKQKHKEIINKMKEKGLRKSKFASLRDINSALFYSLMAHAKIETIAKNKMLQPSQDKIYLILSGKAQIANKLQYKLLNLQQGQIIFVMQNQFSMFAPWQAVTIASVSCKIAQSILGKQYNSLKQLGMQQKSILANYNDRNKRLTHQIKKRTQIIPQLTAADSQFINKIETKIKRFSEYRRAKSCFSSGRFNPTEIISQNHRKFRDLMNINVRLAKSRLYKGSKDTSPSQSLKSRSQKQNNKSHNHHLKSQSDFHQSSHILNKENNSTKVGTLLKRGKFKKYFDNIRGYTSGMNTPELSPHN